jgi:ribosomal protein S11
MTKIIIVVQIYLQPLTALYFGESSAATDVILLMSSGCLDFGPSGSSSRPFAAPCAPHKVAKSLLSATQLATVEAAVRAWLGL